MGVKMNLRIITKYHAADLEIGFLTKSISKPYGYGTAMPTAWELNFEHAKGRLSAQSLTCQKPYSRSFARQPSSGIIPSRQFV